jgi:hypothetical protein
MDEGSKVKPQISRFPDYPISKFPDFQIIGPVLLAADVGGTKTLLGLFEEAPERPKEIESGEFGTLDYDSLVPMIREFLKAEGRGQGDHGGELRRGRGCHRTSRG